MKDDSNRFVNFFIGLEERQNKKSLEIASEFVCRMYAQNYTNDVDEARYKKLMQMSGNINQLIAVTYAFFSQ